MHFQSIIALGACIAAVTAAPLHGRDISYNTVTQIQTVTELVTATVWVDPPSSTDITTTTTSSSVPATTTAVVTPTTTSTTPTTTSTSTSVYVAPAAETPAVVNQPAPAIAPAATTTTTTPAAAATTPAAAATTAQSSGSQSTSKKNSFTGDVTFYDVGQGSCGNMNSDSEMVLAMNLPQMNKATMCGKTITISYGGATHTGTIVDTCMGCAEGAIDLSPALFKAVVPNGDGRVKGVEWWFN